jgi:hypothetical protein
VLWVEPRRAIDQRGERMGERMGECVAHLCGLRRPFGSIGTVYTNVNEVEEVRNKARTRRGTNGRASLTLLL